MVRLIRWSVPLCWAVAVYGQRPVPLADPVEKGALPAGVSNLDVYLDGPRAFVFKDADGTDALHFPESFTLKLGEDQAREFRGREAVVWISKRELEGQVVQHLDVLLWRDAEVRDIGGTLTTGPALFVTLNTTAKIHAATDDVAMLSSTDNDAYREGNKIRHAISDGRLRGLDRSIVHRVHESSKSRSDATKFKKRPIINVRSKGTLQTTKTDTGGQVLTVTGGVYLSRGTAGNAERFEIRADSVVLFLPSAAPAHDDQEEPPPTGLGVAQREARRGAARALQNRRSRKRASDQQLLSAGFGDVEVEGAYLEGDIVMTQGPNMIRASRLYYDFVEERATILDAVVRATMLTRNIPLYLRAAEIRRLSNRSFQANDAILTTSEFHTPHYHLGARRVEIVDLTPGESGQMGIQSGRIDIRHLTLNLNGQPIFYWPHIRATAEMSETAIKSFRTGYSTYFGGEFETKWQLFSVLGLETPQGFDGSLSLDVYTQRGPAIGVNLDYERDQYYGVVRSYLLTDADQDFLGRERIRPSQKDVRGRFLLRHRQFLEDDWQLSLELSYISDEGFLEEFFEREFDLDKEQETLVYLKKQRENWAFTAHLQSRILDFASQTERLPDLGFHLLGEPVGDRATWFSENRIGNVRARPRNPSFFDFLFGFGVPGSGTVARVDTRQELGTPVDLGSLRLTPFASVRGSAWDDSLVGGGAGRLFVSYGIRGSMYLSKIFPDVQSRAWDLDGLRHIIKADLVAWAAHTNHDSNDLYQFDQSVEGIDEIDGVTVGVRQRWQTRRGQGKNRRTVDFVSWDAEVGFFNDTEGNVKTNGFTSFSRPENSLARNHVNSSVIWRINDRTALVSEANYDVNDGKIDILNVSVAVERSPRFSYLLGYRFIEETESNLLGFNMNYRMTEKHSLGVRELFDLDRGRTLDFTIALIRKFPRWFGAVSFALDESEDDVGVSFSIWPEGLPQAALGSRRFTGVTNITSLRRY